MRRAPRVVWSLFIAIVIAYYLPDLGKNDPATDRVQLSTFSTSRSPRPDAETPLIKCQSCTDRVVAKNENSEPPDLTAPKLKTFTDDAPSLMSYAHQSLFDKSNSSSNMKSIMEIRDEFRGGSSNGEDSAILNREVEAFLYKNASSPMYDIVSVKCTSQLCEIQSFAYSDAPSKNWSDVLGLMHADPIWAHFSAEASLLSDENGQSVVVTYLRRKPNE